MICSIAALSLVALLPAASHTPSISQLTQRTALPSASRSSGCRAAAMPDSMKSGRLKTCLKANGCDTHGIESWR